MVTALLAKPWLGTLSRKESNWRFDVQVAGSGILADAGDHLIDALLWTTGQKAQEVAAVQAQGEPAIDLVTAATIRLAIGTPVALAVSGISAGTRFALNYYGEAGRLQATDQVLLEERSDESERSIPLPAPEQTIDGNFVSALRDDIPMCCPAEEAVETVRLLEAIGRSAATGQFIRLL
jgi:predicted dehydrogenase